MRWAQSEVLKFTLNSQGFNEEDDDFIIRIENVKQYAVPNTNEGDLENIFNQTSNNTEELKQAQLKANKDLHTLQSQYS